MSCDFCSVYQGFFKYLVFHFLEVALSATENCDTYREYSHRIEEILVARHCMHVTHVEISDSVNTFTLPKEVVPPGSNKVCRMICYSYIRIG